MAKILVTGGAGFIGSQVVDQLISAGEEVIVVDDLSTGKRSNINPLAKFFYISIQDPHLETVFSREKPEYVIHLAALISVHASVDDPVENAYTNVLGSLNLLEICRKYEVKKLVFSSSAAVYSGEAAIPTTENQPTLPISPYGISKLTMEYYLGYYLREFQIPYVILRYANVYGPRQRVGGESGVVTIFINNLLTGRPTTINSDGEQTRDFIYVADVAEATIAALRQEVAGIFNIGTGQEVSINQLYNTLARIVSRTGEVKYNSICGGHDARRAAFDARLANKIFNFSPKVSLEEGLIATKKWFVDNYYAKENNVFVVVPAWNEEKQIINVLRDLKKQVKNIIVVDDCSTDKTYQAARSEGVIALKHLINRDQGAALQTGIDYALAHGAEIIVTFDADGQHDAREISRMIQPIIDGEAEITLGSRFINNSHVGLPLFRRYLLRAGILFTYLLSGIKLTDTHNGFRAISRRAAEQLRITEDGKAHASEIIDQIAKKKIKFVEVPVTIHYTDYSRGKGQSSLNAINIAARMIFSKLFGSR